MFLPIPSQPPPSLRARELGDEIHRTIEEYEQRHPNTRSSDVRRALQIAGRPDGGKPRVAALGVGLLVAALLGFLVMLDVVVGPPTGAEQSPPFMLWLVGALVVVAALVAVARSRR